MTLYRNLCLAAGTVTLAYIVLKLYISKACEKSTEDEEKPDAVEKEKQEKSRENQIESTEKKTNSNKRKLEESKGAMKIPRQRPNFFLAFQVFNPIIHKHIKKLQESIIAKSPALHQALIDVSTLHVTLGVTHLVGEDDIKKVKEKMADWGEENKKELSEKPITLKFTGVNTFDDTVAFVDIEQNNNYKRLCDLAERMGNLLSSAGFSTDSRKFTPHLTFLKLSKDIKLLKEKKKFKNTFIEMKNKEKVFGEQVISHIQLLSMNHPKDQNGYYKCFHEIKLLDNEMEEDHSECCRPIPKPRQKK